jgi:dTMP kinase
MKRGYFITLEGADGTGKSTQTSALVQKLTDQYGLSVIQTREPGGTPLGEHLRALLVQETNHKVSSWTEALLMSAARAAHIEEVIEPALAAGKWVVCDRFIHSTLAYQGYGGGVALNRLHALNDLVMGTTRPDLTLALYTSRSQAQHRLDARASHEDRFENKGAAYQSRVASAYEQFSDDVCPVVSISGNGTPDCVTDRLIHALNERGLLD